MLEHLATAEGSAWASRSCDELRQQGRTITDGWPGTMSQARLRVRACVSGPQRLAATLSADDLDWLTRTVYLSAKAAWLALAEPGEE